MADIKFTKNELRDQQIKLGQLQRYLPTLQLKKAMLQVQAADVRQEIAKLLNDFEVAKEFATRFSSLLYENIGIDAVDLARVEDVKKSYENVAGVEIPSFNSISFKPIVYNLFESPMWLDSVIKSLQNLATLEVKIQIADEKKQAIEKELREVSIRVNLFEKVMIPNALKNIKVIKVFLGDQQLAAVARAKVAKTKIEERKSNRGSIK